MKPTAILGIALLFVVAFVSQARTQEKSKQPCQVRVVLFVPAGVAPPAEYQRRVDEMADYAEAFLARGLKRWGHVNAVMPFRRSEDGHVEVLPFRGKKKAEEYKPVGIRMEVMDALRQAKKLDGPRQIWWILVYAGDPPKRFDGFLGGFGEEIGGWAVCNFDTSPGRIDPRDSLASEFLEQIALKGTIHELGHGFGLPHIGPLNRDDAGNTLMGPTHYNFRRVAGPREKRVYLCEAEAAMLSLHPAFRGAPDDRGGVPKIRSADLDYSVGEGALVVRGKVQADRKAVYALVADESDARPGEYWTKTYVGKVGPDGSFETIVSEPAPSKGTLKTWFLFDDGSHTGDGSQRSRAGGIAKAYAFANGEWSFE